MTGGTMGKSAKVSRRVRRNDRVAAPVRPLHPMIVQADIPAAQQARAVYEVADVANPYGEVMVGGELRRHKAVRRVAHFETLFRARVFDVSVFRVLAWYDHQLARAAGGMYKCGLDVSGGGSGAGLHPHLLPRRPL